MTKYMDARDCRNRLQSKWNKITIAFRVALMIFRNAIWNNYLFSLNFLPLSKESWNWRQRGIAGTLDFDWIQYHSALTACLLPFSLLLLFRDYKRTNMKYEIKRKAKIFAYIFAYMYSFLLYNHVTKVFSVIIWSDQSNCIIIYIVSYTRLSVFLSLCWYIDIIWYTYIYIYIYI